MADVTSVRSGLIDPALGVVAEFHAEDFNVVERQRRLGQVQIRRQDTREDGSAVEEGSFVGYQTLRSLPLQ